MSSPKVCIIVAACNNRGIGINGKLPWHLRGDMNFFKKITTGTENTAKQNAVIMGRKTWLSIPEKYRPLKSRINFILSKEMQNAPNNTHLARSLEECIEMISQQPLADKIENIFVIGGSSVYQEALKYCDKIYFTRVLADFECDTFLPEFSETRFRKMSDPSVDSSIQEEDGLSYQFEVYEKVTPACEHTPLPYFNVIAAMCNNRGIGYKGSLPWPFLKKDYEHYTGCTSCVSDPFKRTALIKGKDTWYDTKTKEKGNRYNIIVSSTLKEKPDKVEHIAKTFDEALQFIASPQFCKQVDNAWIMGGQNMYKEAIQHPYCHRLYLTRIHADYEADRFFPEFENSGQYKKIKDKYVPDDIYEDYGVKYQFEVYQRNKE